jgi:hypothetical protein
MKNLNKKLKPKVVGSLELKEDDPRNLRKKFLFPVFPVQKKSFLDSKIFWGIYLHLVLGTTFNKHLYQLPNTRSSRS